METATISSTAETLRKLEKFKFEISQKTGRETITFNVEDIDIQKDKMFVNGEQLSESAIKRVLSHLRVKNNFLALSETMTLNDWATVKEVLKKPTASQVVHGRRVPTGDDNVIDDIYMAAPKATGLIDPNVIFTEIVDAIVSTAKDITLKSTEYLEDKDEIVVTLIENDKTLDIFGDESEIWKIGKRIIWNGMSFAVFAYYERVECGSGFTVPKYGFKSNISNNKFNMDKIKKVLEAEITLDVQDLDKHLIDSIIHLNSLNISVREFGRYRNVFHEKLHPEIIEKWFDESKMNKAYSRVATEMPDLWKITADSGENAFNFFKKIIYIASHSHEAAKESIEEAIAAYKAKVNFDENSDTIIAEKTETKKIELLTPREKFDLEIKASEILLKRELDLETIAPKVTWK
jgi:hypothetical protein